MNSIKPAITELEKIYKLFSCLFDDEKMEPIPVITIQSAGRRKVLGWMDPERWKNGETVINEINIVAESLAGTVSEIAETMLHEMVHHCNELRGVNDCSKSQYHNKKFRDLCEYIGLNCEKSRRRGWDYTELTGPLLAMIEAAKINHEAFTIFRLNPEPAKKVGSRLKKWTCGCTIIRAAGEVEVLCKKCGSEFLLEEL